ncbi:Methyltransferase domain 25 [Sergentomyia squamirostris]
MSNIQNFEPNFYEKSKDFRVNIVLKSFEDLFHLVKWKENGGDSAIDVGCGVGDTTKSCIYPLLPKNYSLLVCLDLSTEMLEMARKNFSGITRTNFIQLDVGSSITDAKRNELGLFDHVFSTLCLCYVKNQKQAFQNIFSILHPGGDILISFQAIAPVVEILYKMAERSKWRKTLADIDTYCPYPYRKDPHPKETIENLLKSVGFVDIVVKISDSYDIIETEEAFKEFVKSFPMCNTVPADEEQEFFQDAVELAISMNFITEHLKNEPPMKNSIRRMIRMFARKPAL